MYYCFGCGQGGNVYTFLMEYNRLSFVEALQELAKEYGCQYAEAPTGEMSEAYELQFFQTLRGFFYDHTMNLSDIFRYCG